MADITYVRLKGRFIYVSLLMDVFTRVIRAWQLSQHLNQSLTLKPLEAALCHSVCEIHHSDQGVQYLSKAYVTTLEAHGVEISVARRGRPWENGYAERLIGTLKEEEVNINEYENITEARDRIGDFLTNVYNQKRPHFGVRIFDTYGISTTKLVLTLRNCGLNKRMHFNSVEFIWMAVAKK